MSLKYFCKRMVKVKAADRFHHRDCSIFSGLTKLPGTTTDSLNKTHHDYHVDFDVKSMVPVLSSTLASFSVAL